MEEDKKELFTLELRDRNEENKEWNNGSDSYLKSLVATHGLHNWDQIATNMNIAFVSYQKTGKRMQGTLV